MPRRMRRSSGRYSRRLKTVKYSNETYNFTGDLTIQTGAQAKAVMIASTSAQGTRKVKNIEIQITKAPWVNSAGELTTLPTAWALVYVPEGTLPSGLKFGSPGEPASLYEPNQNVIMSGVVPGNLNSPYIRKTRLARNLNSGDTIQLIIAVPNGAQGATYNAGMIITANYAISF